MHNKSMEIEFDARKAHTNQKKHGVSFDEAVSSMLDRNALAIEDPDSENEARWILVGLSYRQRLLTVIYTIREEQTIRLISARKSTKKECGYYAQRI